MKTNNNQVLTVAQGIELMKQAGAIAGETVRAQVTVRAAIRQVFGETKPSKEDFDAMKGWFVQTYTPKALAAHKNDDGSYRDAYAGLTQEARIALARKAGASYYGDRVREVYGATQRAPRAGGSLPADGPTARDSAEVLRALIDALVTKKGKEAARIEADSLALHAMARQVDALPSLALRADTLVAMMTKITLAVEEAETARATAAAAAAAREAEIEAIVAQRMAALAGGGTVGAALATAATGKGRKRKVA